MTVLNDSSDIARRTSLTYEMERLYLALSFSLTYEKLRGLCETTTFSLKHYLSFYVKDYEDLQMALVDDAVDVSNDLADRKKLCISLAEYITSDVAAEKLFDSIGKNYHVVEKIASNGNLSPNVRMKFFNSANSIELRKSFLQTGKLPLGAYLKSLKSPDLYRTVIEDSDCMHLPEIQEHIIHFASSPIRTKFCKSSAVKYLVDEQIKTLINRGEATSLAENESISSQYQNIFVNLNTPGVDSTLARNDSLTHENAIILANRGDNVIIANLSYNRVVNPNILPWDKIPHRQKVNFLFGKKIIDKTLVLKQCFSNDSIIKEAARTNFPTRNYWREQLVAHLNTRRMLDGVNVEDVPLEWLEVLAEVSFSDE